ncbi:MAG: glycosyltransferase family 39 protein [Bacteroidetes bacterium]|nr:glycosyltransferase family 39 protein [Bacteroidota bacterium]
MLPILIEQFKKIKWILIVIAALISQDFTIIMSKLISKIFRTLTVILLYLIAREFYNKKTDFHSMIFINFIPVFIDFGIFSYVDIKATLFFTFFFIIFYIFSKFDRFFNSLNQTIYSVPVCYFVG